MLSIIMQVSGSKSPWESFKKKLLELHLSEITEAPAVIHYKIGMNYSLNFQKRWKYL